MNEQRLLTACFEGTVWRAHEVDSKGASTYRLDQLCIISALNKQRQQLRLRHLPLAQLNTDVACSVDVSPQRTASIRIRINDARRQVSATHELAAKYYTKLTAADLATTLDSSLHV